MTGRLTWLAAVVTGLAVGGCSSVQGPGSVSLGGIGLARPAPPVAQAGISGETLVAMRLSDGSSGVFRRIALRDGVETWAAADGSAFALRSGVMIATFALGDDLYSADVADVVDGLKQARSGPVTRVHRYLDGEGRVGISAYNCTLSFGTIRNAPGAEGPVRPATERCEGLEESFENEYLVATADGAIVGSTQWVGDATGYLRFASETPRPALTTAPILVPATVIVPSRETP